PRGGLERQHRQQHRSAPALRHQAADRGKKFGLAQPAELFHARRNHPYRLFGVVMTVRIGNITFSDWISLNYEGGYTDTFIFDIHALNGLPPFRYRPLLQRLV